MAEVAVQTLDSRATEEPVSPTPNPFVLQRLSCSPLSLNPFTTLHILLTLYSSLE